MTDAPKKARRDQARETARIQREAEKKRKKRNRIIVQSSVILGAVAVAAIIVLVAVNSIPKPAVGPLNMLSDGILMEGDGTGNIVAVKTDAIPAEGEPVPTDQTKYADKVNIVMYIDYFCPVCQAFEQANAEQIGTWVSQGVATVEYHPISILDGSSLGTEYSTRSANAAACVANYEPDKYFEVTTALYANQPAEQTEGLSDADLITIIGKAGVTDDHVPDCVNDHTFSGWVAEATDRTNAGPIPNSDLDRVKGTPTVLVNGQQYTGAVDDAAAFTAFVSQIGAALETSTPTPTPTPAP